MEQLYASVTGEGSPIVLLHGMTASSRYWEGIEPLLSKNHRVISLDLLGFGRSPKPNMEYDYDAHIAAIKKTLKQIKITTPFTLVGHSMGALIALRMAREYPQQIKKVILIGCPLYANVDQARREITGGRLLTRLAYYGQTSRVLCTVWCSLLRPLSKRIAPLYLSYLTPPVAQDSVLHTWQSYNSSMEHIIEKQSVDADLAQCHVPVLYIYGNEDVAAQPDRLLSLPKKVTSVELHGNHQLVWQQAQKIADLIIE